VPGKEGQEIPGFCGSGDADGGWRLPLRYRRGQEQSGDNVRSPRGPFTRGKRKKGMPGQSVVVQQEKKKPVRRLRYGIGTGTGEKRESVA